MLLASPLRPGAIVLGKMVASLTHLGMLILASLPIIVADRVGTFETAANHQLVILLALLAALHFVSVAAFVLGGPFSWGPVFGTDPLAMAALVLAAVAAAGWWALAGTLTRPPPRAARPRCSSAPTTGAPRTSVIGGRGAGR